MMMMRAEVSCLPVWMQQVAVRLLSSPAAVLLEVEMCLPGPVLGVVRRFPGSLLLAAVMPGSPLQEEVRMQAKQQVGVKLLQPLEGERLLLVWRMSLCQRAVVRRQQQLEVRALRVLGRVGP
jgi:hypothetical protein